MGKRTLYIVEYRHPGNGVEHIAGKRRTLEDATQLMLEQAYELSPQVEWRILCCDVLPVDEWAPRGKKPNG